LLWLDNADHTCSHFDNSTALLKNLQRETYDLLILDWELPDRDGLEVLREVRRARDWQIPVLFATQRGQEQNIVAALESGADDYLVKPLRREEFLARVNAVVRRASGVFSDDGGILRFEPYEIDLNNHVVAINGENVKLSHKEYELIAFLFQNIGHVVSRNHLLESVWGISSDVNTRTIDTHMSRVRNKLSLNPENGWRLTSIYQHGYRLEKLAHSL